MKTAKEFAKEVLAVLGNGSDETSLVVRDLCNRELTPVQPALVEKRVFEAQSILLKLGQPVVSRLAAFGGCRCSRPTEGSSLLKSRTSVLQWA